MPDAAAAAGSNFATKATVYEFLLVIAEDDGHKDSEMPLDPFDSEVRVQTLVYNSSLHYTRHYTTLGNVDPQAGLR